MTYVHGERLRLSYLHMPEWYEVAGETEAELEAIERWLLRFYTVTRRVVQ